MAVVQAGWDSAWVSLPMNSGPVMPWAARYSTIAWVVAAMCASLNAVSRLEPAMAGRAEDDLLVGVRSDRARGRSTRRSPRRRR